MAQVGAKNKVVCVSTKTQEVGLEAAIFFKQRNSAVGKRRHLPIMQGSNSNRNDGLAPWLWGLSKPQYRAQVVAKRSAL